MNEKKVYLYTVDGDLVRIFETTQECADWFDYDREYIYHNLKYCDKIRKDNTMWYRISRKDKSNEEGS